MFASVKAAAFVLLPLAQMPTATWQVAPDVGGRPGEQQFRADKPRAVVLIHGLYLHPLRPELANGPDFHSWQKSGGKLVQALAPDFDVYSFSYPQTTPVETIALSGGLRSDVRKLKELRYKEIVLVGHSAGGIIARQFAEHFPASGVTKVIQVACPNGGSDWAEFPFGLPKPQVPFVRSLGPRHRLPLCANCERPIPKNIEFCTVACQNGRKAGDGIVALDRQWSEDLQKQGAPVVLVPSNHNDAMKNPAPIKAITDLAKERLARWTPEQVEQARGVLFGNPDRGDDPTRREKRRDRGGF